MKLRRTDKKGVLLIEVLLVVTILAVTLTMIIQSLSASYRALYFSKDFARGQMLLEGKMLKLLKDISLSLDFQEEGEFDTPYDKYSYRIIGREVRHGDVSLNEVTVIVSWLGGWGEQEIKAITYFLIPQEERAVEDDE